MISQSCCLANVLRAPRFPSYRPDTASFRSCLLLPPRFLGKREAGFAQEAVRCPPLFFLYWVLLVVALARWSQAAFE